MNLGHAPLSRWGLSFLEWQPQWTVLDIGCGGGANLSRMLRLCPQGKVYGLDYSQVSVDCSCRKNRKALGSRCFVECGTADSIPWQDGMFDVVTAFETVYFWGDLNRCFKEVARVLRPEGRFLICCEASDPADTTWTSRIDGMKVYGPEDLRRMLELTGFSDIRVYTKGRSICIVAS